MVSSPFLQQPQAGFSYARLFLACMGNVALLRESYEGDRARTTNEADHHWPYRISRNPLYLGGNVFIFVGAALVLGSPSALVLIALHLPLMDLFIRREEQQLERTFGEEWIRYKSQVHRWI
jgi:protein-S-isoprenylcysteine O-methyltransferase Ste14